MGQEGLGGRRRRAAGALAALAEGCPAGAEVRQAYNLAALIDAGASVTGIDEGVLGQLGYLPVNVAGLSTPSGT